MKKPRGSRRTFGRSSQTPGSDVSNRCQGGNGLGGSAFRSGDPSPAATLSDYPIHRIMHSKYRRDKPQKLNSVGLSNQTVARKTYAPADCSTGPNTRDGAQPWDNPSWGSEESGGRSRGGCRSLLQTMACLLPSPNLSPELPLRNQTKLSRRLPSCDKCR